MKIGILSDTHGHLPRTRAACDALARHELGAILHCGDVGSAAVLVELALVFEPRSVPIHAVKGNVDLFSMELTPFVQAEGVVMMGAVGELQLAGKRLAIVHGHDPDALDAAIESGSYDYIFTGHTHKASDRRLGPTRIINPGACYRTNSPSIAILNLSNDDLRYLPLSP